MAAITKQGGVTLKFELKTGVRVVPNVRANSLMGSSIVKHARGCRIGSHMRSHALRETQGSLSCLQVLLAALPRYFQRVSGQPPVVAVGLTLLVKELLQRPAAYPLKLKSTSYDAPPFSMTLTRAGGGPPHDNAH